MPRINIHFTQKTFEELKTFVLTRYGARNALSLTIEQAVKEYLAHQRLKEEISRLEEK